MKCTGLERKAYAKKVRIGKWRDGLDRFRESVWIERIPDIVIRAALCVAFLDSDLFLVSRRNMRSTYSPIRGTLPW